MARLALQLPSARHSRAVQVFRRGEKRKASEHAVSTTPVSVDVSRSRYPVWKDELSR